MMSTVEWKAPSPGTWEFDASHSTGPMSRFLEDVMLTNYTEGMARGFAAVGAPLATIEACTINGFAYMCPRPLGGPAEPKGPPPKLLMTLLFALVPELRRRKRRATKLFKERPWRAAMRQWETSGQDAAIQKLRGLEADAPAELDDAALATLVERIAEVGRRIVLEHFECAPLVVIPLGDFFVHGQRWAGLSAKASARAIAGFSSATTAPLAMLDAVVDALRAADALHVLERPASEVEAAIAEASPDAATALEAYLEAYGLHIISGITLFDLTLAEAPEVWVASLRGRLVPNASLADPRSASEALARQMRSSVPEAHRAQWDEIVADAQAVTHYREATAGALSRWMGVARRALLETGRRLVERGIVEVNESALDMTPAEVAEILRGRGPSGDELRRRTQTRIERSKLTPPRYVGPPPMGPPLDRFPPAVARVVEAATAMTSRFNADADPIEGSGIAGHGVSRGVVEGVARVVRGPEDFTRVRVGDILVTRTTSNAFNVVLALAGGIVTEVGGLICHAAIVSREFGIPGIVGAAGAMTEIPDGALVRIDGDRGVVEVLEAVAPEDSAPAAPEDTTVKREPRAPASAGRCVPLLDAVDRAVFGGKAANLARVAAGDVPIPEGVALDCAYTEAIAARDAAHLERLAETLATLPGPWAVRSSALAEDSDLASFAGQFTTVLDVGDFEACVSAIRTVWDSAQAAGVIAYRERMGLSEPVRMAVVIQRLLDARVAGVLFTREDGDHLVEASWGLAEPLVSGEIEPDRFRLDATGALVSSRIADKRHELRAGGTREVDDARVSAPSLTESQLTKLAALAHRCAVVFGQRQDVEWVFTEVGALVCVQSRPITAALPAPDCRPRRSLA